MSFTALTFVEQHIEHTKGKFKELLVDMQKRAKEVQASLDLLKASFREPAAAEDTCQHQRHLSNHYLPGCCRRRTDRSFGLCLLHR